MKYANEFLTIIPRNCPRFTAGNFNLYRTKNLFYYSHSQKSDKSSCAERRCALVGAKLARNNAAASPYANEIQSTPEQR